MKRLGVERIAAMSAHAATAGMIVGIAVASIPRPAEACGNLTITYYQCASQDSGSSNGELEEVTLTCFRNTASVYTSCGSGSGESPGGGANGQSPCSIPSLAIDVDVLAKHEGTATGGSNYQPYVPNKGIGVGATSGATISIGVDLSNFTAAQVQAWAPDFPTGAATGPRVFLAPSAPASNQCLGKVSPRGVVGTCAQNLLTMLSGYYPAAFGANAITAAASSELFNGVLTNLEAQIANRFPTIPLSSLPTNTLTAIVDAAWNLGAGGLNTNFGNDISTENWIQLATDLQAFAKSHSDNRFLEDAAAIMKDINSKYLPNLGNPCA